MDEFIRFGNELYKDNEYAVPDLAFDIKDTFNPRKNAAFDFCECQMFLAVRDGETVGRIVGLINNNANAKWQTKNVRFGWIDFIDDINVSKALLKAVEDWGRERGMTDIIGPMGFTDFDKEGMLIEGFDKLGSMTTIYNYPYYPEHMEKLGYTKEVDWVQIRVRVPEVIPPKFARVTEMVTKRYNLKITKLTSKLIYKENYGKRIFQLLNDAYSPLFGYSELSEKQQEAFINTYFKLINLDFVTVVESADGELISVGITMGSLSKAIRKSKGKLLPFGWWHLLKALKFCPEETVEMLLIAVKPSWQGKGINALLFSDLIPIYNKYKFVWAETGPQLESNKKELSQWETLNPEFPKRRRCYTKSIKG